MYGKRVSGGQQLLRIGHQAVLLLVVRVPDSHGAQVAQLQGLEVTLASQSLGLSIDTQAAVVVFELFHGLGLATKVMDLEMSSSGLLTNLIAFNVGFELGQVIVLAIVVWLFSIWRDRPSFTRYAVAANVLLIGVSLWLTSVQILGFIAR